MDIKEELCLLAFCSENDGDTNDLIKKVKIETSDSDTKAELEDSTCCSHNEEDHLMRFIETIKESEIETKIDIKEHWWLEGDDLYVHDDIKDGTQDFYAMKQPRIYKDVSSYTSDLFSSEDLGTDLSFNMKKDGPERESGRKYQSQKNVVTDISSIKTSVCSETSSSGKVVSMASSSKQSKVLQQNNTNKQDIYKENCKSIMSHELKNSYKHDVSKKCSKYSSHLEKYSLTLDSKETTNCEAWDKGLMHLSFVEAHRLIDDGKQTHKCNICNKGFTTLLNLNKHKLIHDGIKAHKCIICNKAFTYLSNLINHKLIHEGLKPHKCIICKRAFTRLSHLKEHKLIHEGIKQHKCMICNKAYTRLSDLKQHKLIHEGIKPHKCMICNKAFTRLSRLKEQIDS